MAELGSAFAQDHRLIEEALDEVSVHAGAGRWEEATRAFTGFRRRIERHIEIEETVLFPAVEAGAETSLTAILRKGHRDLRVFFDEVADALGERDAGEAARILASMRALLQRHDEKEEAELYPAAAERLAAGASAVAGRLDR